MRAMIIRRVYKASLGVHQPSLSLAPLSLVLVEGEIFLEGEFISNF